MNVTLDNYKLYKRFIAGKNDEEALINYKLKYNNSGFIMHIIDEIKNYSLKNYTYKNQKTYLEYIEKYKKILINFYSIGGVILPEKCLINFIKKAIDLAKKNNIELLILTSPESLYFEKYKRIRKEAILYANKNHFNNLYVTQPAYIINTISEIQELEKNGKFNISLVCGGFRLYNTNDINIMENSDVILDKYLKVREYLYNNKIKVIDNTNNFELRKKLYDKYGNNILVNYFYGTNDSDKVWAGFNQNVCLSIAPDYKRSLNFTFRRNNDNSSYS